MMVEATKITLSNKELELVCNTDWIFTKHTIIQKVMQLFGDLVPVLENEFALAGESLPKEIFINRAKISKGENYQLLPYVMLDYPRFFSKTESFAVRTFFWWGNFFSVTLQLSGKYQEAFQSHLSDSFDFLKQNNYSVCINETPWQHDFGINNYLPATDLNKEEFTAILNRKPFIKLAKRIPLQLWETVPSFIIKSAAEIIQLIKVHQAPSL